MLSFTTFPLSFITILLSVAAQPEEMLERQTTQIGKVLRSAIAANRSLGGQAMNDIESTFRAMDTDGSGDLDYEEFDRAMTRLGMG